MSEWLDWRFLGILLDPAVNNATKFVIQLSFVVFTMTIAFATWTFVTPEVWAKVKYIMYLGVGLTWFGLITRVVSIYLEVKRNKGEDA